MYCSCLDFAPLWSYYIKRQKGEVMQHSATHVVIVGPKSLDLEDIQALKAAFKQRGTAVAAYRTDVDFTFPKFKDELASATHALIVLGQLNGYTDTILRETDEAGISTSLLSLYDGVLVQQFSRRLSQRRTDVVIVHSFAEHACLSRWNLHTMVAENIARSAPDIAQAIVSKPIKQRPAVA
ncbi:MAG: hypothetical protein UY74_C0038G0009 [Candidatus Kaiserbacteria bacterium GW2011_GWC2_52_8b]|uniref:Uncharacterized protein n=1 Tax=Candidatus Kaiserbacteria bacterium GW2011_GWC2_52_8b TaxID=1618676 RepID=A0A0G1ZQN8_9BACT|nr:MAG: hypothetical protein UY74_C0038G0009 [Candidatus Kaiserbacteria bacterium GW2011_GWC2_52_8b]